MEVKGQMVKSVLTKTQNTILSAAFVIAAASGLNAGLGFVKNRLLASQFGVSNDLAIFYTADRIPNLIYSLLIIGAVATVFIPIFTEQLKKDQEKAFKTASSIINTVFIFFLLISLVMCLFSHQIIGLLAIGKFTTAEVSLGAKIMNFMLISQMILVAGSLISSILQSFKQFLIPALAPVAYNLGMIIGIFFLSERYGIMGPTYGTLIGAAFHFLLQIPFVTKTGYKQSLGLDIKDDGLKEVMQLVPPRLLSVLLSNGLATINNSFAILISSASVVYLKFGLQLQSFPVTLFGASIAAASLPTLSEESDYENRAQFKKTFLTSLHQMMFLVLPLSIILLVLRIPVVRLVYGVSKFPWEATIQTAYVLAFYSLSIFSQSAIYLITRAFFALKDTNTPVKVSLFTIFLNIGLSLLFILQFHWGVWSVAFSYAITSFIDMVMMMFLLNKKLGGFKMKEIFVPFTKISYAALLMGITLYIPLKILDVRVFDTSHTINLLIVTGIAGLCGSITYLIFTRILNVREIELFYKLIRKLDFRVKLKDGQSESTNLIQQ